MLVTGTAQKSAWVRRELPPVERVRPGLWSIPVPIPNSPLRYTLSYAFVGAHGAVLVDPGWDTPDARAALTAGLGLAGVTVADVTGVVITHVHFDHHGLSGWLRETSGAWIAMHPVEATTLPARVWADRSRADDEAWLRALGVPPEDLDGVAIDPDRMTAILSMVEPDRFLNDGDRLPLEDRRVTAVWTPGHTPGHLCLHDPDAGVLLTGDHLLPRISPNIGVHGGAGGDPLTDYLETLGRTGRFDREEALPGHEYRFRGIDARAAELIAHHRDRGREILAVVDELPAPTAWAIAERLTWSRGWDALRGMMRRMALAETVAHLRQLETAGALVSAPPLYKRRSPVHPVVG